MYVIVSQMAESFEDSGALRVEQGRFECDVNFCKRHDL
jgi:hypothetical protein